MTHVALMDAQTDTHERVAPYLESHGYKVSAAQTTASLSELLERSPPDLIVLDLKTIRHDDSDRLRRNLDASLKKPLILLTTSGDDSGGSLPLAADGYLDKPVDPIAWLARIDAALGRGGLPPSGAANSRQTRFDRWTLDHGQRALIGVDGSLVCLSRSECRLLEAFLKKPGQILTREQLLELTQRRDADVFDRSIDNLVKRLRKKIESNPRRPSIIRTYWRRGYRLVGDVISLSAQRE